MKRLFVLICIIVSSITNAQTKAKQIDSLLSQLHKEDKFYGNVLIAEKGEIIFEGSFGKANIAADKDLNSSSVFELASVSKQFTAMGIMLLKKQGKLNYDDSLRKFFPGLPYHNITVRHLLNHTSGLPDYMDLFSKHWDSARIAVNKDMIELLARHKPTIHFKPGEKWEYSNTGYALLGSIIEKASGKEFGKYLEKNIFEPLGMKHTMVFRRRFEKKKIDNYAYGYVYDATNKKFILPDDFPATASMVYSLDGIVGDGTVNSTTIDLLKWDRALYTESLLSKAQLAEAFEPGTLNDGKKTRYGFGWFLPEMKGMGKMVSHTGGWPGYNTLIERHLDTDKTIIILRNYDRAGDVITPIRRILYGMKEEVKNEMTVAAEILKQYVGVYELAPEFTITVTVEEDKLFAQATGQSKFQLFAEKADLFFLKVVEAKVEFVRDENKQVKSLVLYQSGQEVPGVKIR